MSINIYKNRAKYPLNIDFVNVLIMCALIFIGVGLGGSSIGREKPEYVPLLLNSGLSDANYAEVRVTLWFENVSPTDKIMMNLPHKNWQWSESYLITHNNNFAYSISGKTIVNKEQERDFYNWYQKLSHEIISIGGIPYFDERIYDSIDIAKYSVLNGISPVQLNLSDSVFSLTGFKEELNPGVYAGANKVNIQLITTAGKNSKKTALAFPVLLEEF